MVSLQEHTDRHSKTCGTKKTWIGQVKYSAWWNDTVKDATTEKKKLYKVWVKSKREEDHVNYRLARRHSKGTVRMAKEQPWKTWRGTKRTVQALNKTYLQKRQSNEITRRVIQPNNSSQWQKWKPISDEDSIKNRWQEYFKELLNPSSQGNTQSQFHPCYPEHEEPNILRSEVQHALKTNPSIACFVPLGIKRHKSSKSKNKAAAIDGSRCNIPADASGVIFSKTKWLRSSTVSLENDNRVKTHHEKMVWFFEKKVSTPDSYVWGVFFVFLWRKLNFCAWV